MTKLKVTQNEVCLVLIFWLFSMPAIAEEAQVYGLAYSDMFSPTDYGIGVGYSLSTTMSAEISYLSIKKVPFFGAAGFFSVSGINIGVVGYLPVVNSISLIGKIGTFSSTAKSNKTPSDYNNTTISTGIGIQYTVSQNISLRLLIESLGTLKSSAGDMGWDYSLITGGVAFNF
jgi:opacity protein-like surface antigen